MNKENILDLIQPNQRLFLKNYELVNGNTEILKKGGYINYIYNVNQKGQKWNKYEKKEDDYRLFNGGILIGVKRDRVKIKCWYMRSIIELKYEDCFVFFKIGSGHTSKEQRMKMLVKKLENIITEK